MRVIRLKHFPLGDEPLNLCGIVFCKDGVKIKTKRLNAERIKAAQQIELLFVGYYIVYWAEFLFNYMICGNSKTAKSRVSLIFEQNKYNHFSWYCQSRRLYAMWRV
jgi:hypothetical protein